MDTIKDSNFYVNMEYVNYDIAKKCLIKIIEKNQYSVIHFYAVKNNLNIHKSIYNLSEINDDDNYYKNMKQEIISFINETNEFYTNFSF